MLSFYEWLEGRDSFLFESSEPETTYERDGVTFTKICKKCGKKLHDDLPLEPKPDRTKSGDAKNTYITKTGEVKIIGDQTAYRKRIMSSGQCERCHADRIAREEQFKKDLEKQKKDAIELYRIGKRKRPGDIRGYTFGGMTQ